MIEYTDTKYTGKQLTIEELDPGVRNFISIKNKFPSGKSPNGRPHYEYTGIEYFKTKAGSIELGLWLELIEGAFKQEGKWDLYEAIYHYCKECQWLKKDKEIRLHAAECLCNEAYKAWKDFEYIETEGANETIQ